MRGSQAGAVFAFLVAVSGWSAPALAGEPTCDTFITSVPYTINAQGHYCLANNVAYSSTTGEAILINANSVVLDLRGYKIGGQAAGTATQAFGVRVPAHSTVTIRNGLIRGFARGVYFDHAMDDNKNNIVEDINADANTLVGIFVGAGANNTVRNCVVGNTGGTTFVVTPTYGVLLFSTNSFATNNSVTGTVPAVGGTEYYGIFVGDGSRAVNNQVIGDGNTGVATNYCFSLGVGAIYRDNIASGCGTSYFGGTAVGTTNYP